MVLITIVTGVFVNQLITGGPHIVGLVLFGPSPAGYFSNWQKGGTRCLRFLVVSGGFDWL